MTRTTIATWILAALLGVTACNGRSPATGQAPPTAPPHPPAGPDGATPEKDTPADVAPKTAPALPVPPPAPPPEVPSAAEVAKWYPWPRRATAYESLATRVHPPPERFTRVPAAEGTYAWWLRNLPLLAPGTPPRLFDGKTVSRGMEGVSAVVDLDTGTRDLQQCMDVLIRLRAEYLRAAGQETRISFRYPGGRYLTWNAWTKGFRPDRETRELRLVRKASWSNSPATFQWYLRTLFQDTGTVHHQDEPRVAPADLAIGDFFVYPPASANVNGHAVVVLDLAVSADGGRRIVVGQGDTPATDFHVLREPGGTAWFHVPPGDFRGTFLWPTQFSWDQLRRFRH